MSILNSFIVYKPLKDTLKFRRGTRKAYFTLVGLPGRARACHQKRGGVGIFVHVPGHNGLCAPLPTAINILVSIVSSSTIEMGTTDNPDPFAIFHTPPPNETAGERAAREEREAAARKVSDRIDEELKQEKARLKRQKVIRVLLLGQSESGESPISLSNYTVLMFLKARARR